MVRAKRKPYLWEALIPIFGLMLILLVCLYKYNTDPQIPIILACIVAAVMALRVGCSYEEIRSGILNSVFHAIEALIIIMIVGMVIGTWVLSGTVPAIIYYGLDLLSPHIFLVAGCLLCALVSTATGSSWTASGTVGIALMGIAGGLGINPALAAGMVISGAYFGDKLSPFSDSTNVAAAVAETNLFTHVGSMVYTTLPSFILTLVIYGIIGANFAQGDFDYSRVTKIQEALTEEFSISPWVLIPPVFVIVAAVKKIPPVPSLLTGAILGGIWAIVFQDASFLEVCRVLQFGYVSHSDVEDVAQLLTRGGIDNIMWTISLIIFALAFGGICEEGKFTEVIIEKMARKIKKAWELIALTVISGIISNYILTDQYLSIIVPGRMYAPQYDKLRLQRRVLSRSLEDGATLWSPLCPWNGCGVYQAATLGVATFSYLPYAFLSLINPIVSIVFAILGWSVFYEDDDLAIEGSKDTRFSANET